MSRWDVLELGRRATAQAAAAVLDRLAERMPFAVRAISIDNGSEFMADFETACQARGIRLFVLPPRSPKLHGSVERANRTHTEEFYEVTTAEPELGPDEAAGRPAAIAGRCHPGACPRLPRLRVASPLYDRMGVATALIR